MDGKSDKVDSEAIYNLLENEIIPLYYKIDDDDIPHSWVRVIKEAMKSVGPRFSTRLMVKEYSREFYLNALKSAT